MVSVAGSCDGLYPWGAAILAAIACPCYMVTSALMVRLKIDDPVDAVAVHCSSGLVGLLLGPVFRQGGVLSTGSSESLNMLLWNFIGMWVLIGYYIVMSTLMFGALYKLGIFR